MWFNLTSRDSSKRSLTHSQDALSLPESSNKGDGVSQRGNSGVFVSVIPLWGCPRTSAKTQQGAFMRAPSLLFQTDPITQAPSYEAGVQQAQSGPWETPESKHWQVMSQLPITIQQGRSLGKFPAHTVLLLSHADLDSSFSPFSILPEVSVWLGTRQPQN